MFLVVKRQETGDRRQETRDKRQEIERLEIRDKISDVRFEIRGKRKDVRHQISDFGL